MKIAVVGPPRAGKTCSIRRMIDEKVTHAIYSPTVGCETWRTEVTVSGEKKPVVLWDTAGVDKLKGLIEGAYTEARGALVFMSSDSPTDLARVADLHRVAPDAVVHYVTINRSKYSGAHLGRPQHWLNLGIGESIKSALTELVEDILAKEWEKTGPIDLVAITPATPSVDGPRKVWLSDVDGGHVTLYETLEEAQDVLRKYIYPVTKAGSQMYHGFHSTGLRTSTDGETRVYRDLEKCMKWATECMITEAVLYD